MGIGTLILLGLVTGEIIALVKIGKQNKRIKELEKKTEK
jgi:hypothetical protein